MRTQMKGFIAAVFLSAYFQSAYAAGPAEVAKADFSLWPLPITGVADFDTASRAELIVSAIALDDYSRMAIQPGDLGIKSLHADSLMKWEESAKQEWLSHFSDASADCTHGELGCGFKGGTWEQFIDFAKRVESQDLEAKKYQAWLTNSRHFYAAYLKEQLRLAALFPAPTSEILKVDSSELLGDEFSDRQFLLSFDDGPTAKNGDTERYVSLLDQHGLSAFFFVLGDALEQRLKTSSPDDLRKIYSNQCMASHGYVHKPHTHLEDWKGSLDKTSAMVNQVFPEATAVMFRPPYGQRQPKLVQFLDHKGARVILWNIDSQDWNNKISADEVAERIKKLMLLKRRGILLFHDVHPKSLTALPSIFDFAGQTGIEWVNCHQIKSVKMTSNQ